MGFDRNKFLAAGFCPRTKDVPLPDLAEFFSESEKPPVWRVRGLTGIEVAQVNEAVDKYRNLGALVGKILGGSDKEKVDAAVKALGYGDGTPADIVRRQEYLRIGSLDPVVDRDLASRFCEFFPIEFYQVTNEILALTGQGHVPGKRKASGGTTECTPA